MVLSNENLNIPHKSQDLCQQPTMTRIHQFKGGYDETKTSQFCMLKSISMNRLQTNVELGGKRFSNKAKR